MLDINQRKEAERNVRVARQELEERVRQRTDELDRSMPRCGRIRQCAMRNANCELRSI